MKDAPAAPEVVVVGSVHMDLVASAARLPRRGESLVGRSFAMHPGGKAGNQAVAAARQGARTAIVARLGDDLFGRDLRGRLAAAGVDVSLVQTDDELATGASPILAEEGGDYASIIVPGASLALTPARLAPAAEALRSCAVLLLQLEIPVATSLAAVDMAKRGGGLVIINPAPVPPDWDEDVDHLLSRADVLIANRHEAEALAESAVQDEEGVARAGVKLLRRFGLRAAIVTLGAEGVLMVEPAGARRVPGHPTTVADTVGAGDALAGAIAAALARGESLLRAVEIGNAAGALAVQRQGAYDAAPTLAETMTFLAAQRAR
jgi:ribokinase